MQNFKFSYDDENDDLFLHSAVSKSKGSVELGNLIFDYNSKKELVGIEILNASKVLGDLLSEEKTTVLKEVLMNLTECKIEINSRNKLLIIKIFLSGKNIELKPILSVPKIDGISPALAYA
ncbi:DUF2283 domain-containing protein [Candidatus Woesearchaeota archaeon]|nr:DUF2283 domain-containing protein [Candidatus Woesearchaeota archaeon]